jgi:hypothetical protein
MENIYSNEELEKKLSDLRVKKEELIKRLNEITKGIKYIDLEIAKWMTISPNQVKIDFDDNN